MDPITLTSADISPEIRELLTLLPTAAPPATVRLEPDSITGDPAPGAEARIGDPAWMLGRQWQLGELTGEDAGTVVSVDVSSRALPVTGWAPLDEQTVGRAGRLGRDVGWRPWPQGSLLEELVQDVSHRGFGAGLRQRAEAGAQLLDQLVDAGEGELAATLAARFPLSLTPDPGDPGGGLDPAADRLHALLEGAVPDGAAIAADVAGAGDAGPAWAADAHDPGVTVTTLQAWLGWVGGMPDSGHSWSLERLEYRFALRFGAGPDALTVRGTQYGRASVGWSDLEWVDRGEVPPDLPGAPDGRPVASTARLLATPLRYPAMPADRYWQLEDGAVDLGAIEAQPSDLARLCLAEFALTSADDWLDVPVDGLLGAVNQITEVRLTDDFGETVAVPELPERGFTLFSVAAADGARLPGIVLPPVAAATLSGTALEEIWFLRDELANLAWAVEQTVPGRSGDPRARASEPPPPRPTWPDDLDPDERVYRLQSQVPAHWIPLVPVSLTPGTVSLRKGALLRDGEPLLPAGVTLAPTPLTFPGEELPREGVRVRAVPRLARRADGGYARWIGYRVTTGRGEASSRLAFDQALSRRDHDDPLPR